MFRASNNRGLLTASTAVLLLLSTRADGASCFERGIKKWLTRTKVPTAALSRKLPPVIDLAGFKTKIVVTKAQSVPAEALETMAVKLRAELLKDRTRGVSLDDPHPDTELRCRVTALELTEQKQERSEANITNNYTVVIGNVEASVEVHDLKTGRVLDSENLKHKYERWYKTSTIQTGQIRSIPLIGKKPKTSDDERLPTAGERLSAVLEGISRKVAQRLVPIDERFDVELPTNMKELQRIAEGGNWGALKEKAESMTPLPRADEDSCRLYLAGLATEALAYGETDPKKAQDLLVSAASIYEKAKSSNSSEEYFTEPINRTQESLERYLVMERINKLARANSRPKESPAAAPASSSAAPRTSGAPAAEVVYDNQYLIRLKKSGSSDEFILSEIHDATDAKFDAGPAGIAQLSEAGLSDAVKLAVKDKMRKAAPAKPAAKSPVKR